MNKRLMSAVMVLLLCSPLFAQTSGPAESSDLSADEILIRQALGKPTQQNSHETLNEQMQALASLPKSATDYLLGPGDVIEVTVVGIPGLEKKEFTLDSEGRISVPYIGEVELLGMTVRDSEARIAQLFSISLLEDPQVSVSIREHKSQNYYVMGAVRKPGKYSMSEATDILDALSLAGGLTERADAKIKLYRFSQKPGADNFVPSNPMEIDLHVLLENARSNNRMAILSGDVIEVTERKERNYYVLGDVLRPGPFLMNQDEPIVFSRALGSAGGMLKTASGKNTVIIRQKEGSPTRERIQVNAYAVLKGEEKDIELIDNDLVIVPGSASKTLGKSFLSGVSSVLSALIVIAAR